MTAKRDFDRYPELDDLDVPLAVYFHYADVDGRQEVVGLELWTVDHPMPKGSHDDRISLFSEDPDKQRRGLETRDVMAVARIFRRKARHDLQPKADKALAKIKRPAKAAGRGRPYSDDDMRSALHIFDTARGNQQPGTKAVAEEFGITPKAAERLVARSRERFAEPAPAAQPRKATTKRPRKGRT